MSNEESFDTLEIADLEQDIGGVCAVEAAEASISAEGLVVVCFVPPK
jgi:hypothetical protein